jgi:hypothetical protein
MDGWMFEELQPLQPAVTPKKKTARLRLADCSWHVASLVGGWKEPPEIICINVHPMHKLTTAIPFGMDCRGCVYMDGKHMLPQLNT